MISRSSGNKVPSFLRMSGFLFLDEESENVIQEIIDNESSFDKEENKTDNDLTLF